MQIELSADEVRAVLGMLDLATKTGGLQVAQHAIPIAVKLQAALDAAVRTDAPVASAAE